MKSKNIDTIQRALGVIDGISFVVKDDVANALAMAVEMIEGALTDEEGGKDDR